MGSGKTIIGKELASIFDLPLYDTDLMIEQLSHCSVVSYFKKFGEAKFRALETQVLYSLEEKNGIVVTGGGLPCHHQHIEWMKTKGKVVYLQTEVSLLYQRLNRNSEQKKRPLLCDLSPVELKIYIQETLKQREPFYLRADLVFQPLLHTTEDLARLLTPFAK